VVCLQVKLCDPHLSALEVRFSRQGAIQIYVYLCLHIAAMTLPTVHLFENIYDTNMCYDMTDADLLLSVQSLLC